jgi:hypothetical protein
VGHWFVKPVVVLMAWACCPVLELNTDLGIEIVNQAAVGGRASEDGRFQDLVWNGFQGDQSWTKTKALPKASREKEA